MFEDAPVNTGAVVWPDEGLAYMTVRRMQIKLHRWAKDDVSRRFGDLFNLVYDPAFLVHAWQRVSTNAGGKTPGVDKVTVAWIESRVGVEEFLGQVRDSLRSGEFQPVEVRQVVIPKASGKLRKLGIPTVVDRVVQASLKAVLEPIFEADFLPCSYGFRPNRRAQDAIAEIHFLATHGYEWVLEADIQACFDEIGHTPLMDRVRRRIKDKRVLALVKAFLGAGVMTTTGNREQTLTGTPQGGLCSAEHKDPCGVPVTARRTVPSCITPARRNARSSPSRRRSLTLSCTADINPECGIASKQFATSVSTTHRLPLKDSSTSTCKASCADRLGRNPNEHGKKSASKIGSMTIFTAACTTRSRIAGIDNGRCSAEPGLGINTRRAGNGRNRPACSSAASSSRRRVTPYSSTSAMVMWSMPGAPKLRRTNHHARAKTSLRWTLSYSAWNRRPGSALAAR